MSGEFDGGMARCGGGVKEGTVQYDEGVLVGGREAMMSPLDWTRSSPFQTSFSQHPNHTRRKRSGTNQYGRETAAATPSMHVDLPAAWQ